MSYGSNHVRAPLSELRCSSPMEVEVPEGCGPGDLLLVTVGESDVEVRVPDGCEAGDTFVVDVETDGESEYEADTDQPEPSVPAEERPVEAAEEGLLDEEEEFMIEIAASLAPSRRMKLGHKYRLQAASDSDEDAGDEPKLEPESEGQYVTIFVTVPEGSQGGDSVTVPLDDGREVVVTIPEGLGPGDQFECSVSAEEEDEETTDAEQPVSDQGSDAGLEAEPAPELNSEHEFGRETDPAPQLVPEPELPPELEPEQENAAESTESAVADVGVEIAGERRPDLRTGVDASKTGAPSPGVGSPRDGLNEDHGEDGAHTGIVHRTETEADPVVPQVEPESQQPKDLETNIQTAPKIEHESYSSALSSAPRMVILPVAPEQEPELPPEPADAAHIDTPTKSNSLGQSAEKPLADNEQYMEQELDAKPGLNAAVFMRQEASRQLSDEEAATVLREEQTRRVGWLQRVPIFKPVTSKSVFMEELARRLEVRTIRKGEMLIQKGDVTGTEMYFIARGAAEVLNSLEQPAFIKLREGDFCGEGALLEDAPRNAFVRVQTDTAKLYVLDRENLQQVLRSYPDADKVIRAPLEQRRLAREKVVREMQQAEQEERKRKKREKQRQARQEKERKERYEAAKKAKAEKDREAHAQAQAEEQAKAKAKAAIQRRLEQERKERVAAAAMARREMLEVAAAAAQSSNHAPEDEVDGEYSTGWSEESEEDHSFESIVGPQKILTVEEPQFQGWRKYADEVKVKREEDEMAAAMGRSLLYQTPPKSTESLVERGKAMHAAHGLIQMKKAEERANMQKRAAALANRHTKSISAEGAEDLVNRLYKPAKRSDARLEDNSVRANANFVQSLRGPATPKRRTGSAQKRTGSSNEPSHHMVKSPGGGSGNRDAEDDEFADLEALMSSYGGAEVGGQGTQLFVDSRNSDTPDGSGSGVFDRLGSPQNFTGVHKHRARAAGKAKGRGTGRGAVANLRRQAETSGSASVVSGGDDSTPEPEPEPEEPEEPAIFSRLTNPEFFTGTHVHRFQSSAKKGRRRVRARKQGAKVTASPRPHSRRTQEPRARGRGRAKGDASGRGAAGDRSKGRTAASSGREPSQANRATADEDVELSRFSHSPGSDDTSPSESFLSSTERRIADVDDVSSHDSDSSGRDTASVASSTIFDKLTDHEQYTGAHRHRFDKKGNGRGLAGRDSIQKGAGHANRSAVVNSDGAVHDLSQIVRPSFYGGKQNVDGRRVSGALAPLLLPNGSFDTRTCCVSFSLELR